MSQPFGFKWESELFLAEHHLRSGAFNMPSNHYHDAYEIYYLVSGERRYFIKDQTYHIITGDLVLINPNELHKTNEAGSPFHERIMLNFKKEFLKGWNESDTYLSVFNHGVSVIRLDPLQQGRIRELLLKVINECNNQLEGFMDCSKALLTELLIEIFRYLQQTPRFIRDKTNETSEKIFEVVRYLNDHYREDLTLKTIKERFFISPYHFSRAFKRITGFNFIEYLNSVRTREAQKLLKETKLSVTKISEKVGFENLTHFGRVFKKIAGVSPSNYRKSHMSPLFIN